MPPVPFTDPPKPKPEPERPYTRFEVAVARMANTTADLARKFAEAAAARRAELGVAAEREAEAQRARKARFEACREWVRAHPDDPGV